VTDEVIDQGFAVVADKWQLGHAVSHGLIACFIVEMRMNCFCVFLPPRFPKAVPPTQGTYSAASKLVERDWASVLRWRRVNAARGKALGDIVKGGDRARATGT